MSTTARGDAFEQRVYEALAKELRNERLCASPRSAKIFRKKPYHSRDRQAQIVTDVSIEAFLPERERPSLVWIFECKDYTGSIPVDDIEEFQRYRCHSLATGRSNYGSLGTLLDRQLRASLQSRPGGVYGCDDEPSAQESPGLLRGPGWLLVCKLVFAAFP